MNLNPIDAGSQMIADGIDAWAIGLGDSMINASGCLANHSYGSSTTENLIFSISTFTYNPLKDQFVKDMILHSVMIYVFLALCFCFIGGAYVVASRSNGTREFVGMVDQQPLSLSKFVMCMTGIIFIPFLLYFILWLPLIINYVLTSMFMACVMEDVTPSPDNVFLYLGLAVMYLGMTFLFIWRTLIIGLTNGFGLVILLLAIVPTTRKLGMMLFTYYIVMAFMQVIIVATTCLGIQIIQGLPTWVIPQELTGYVLLGLLLLTEGIILILGPITVMKLIKTGGKVIV